MWSETRPAAAEDLVVDILDTDAGETANQVEAIEQLLKIEKRNFPGMLLLSENAFNRLGRVAVAASGVMKNDRQLAQESPAA